MTTGYQTARCHKEQDHNMNTTAIDVFQLLVLRLKPADVHSNCHALSRYTRVNVISFTPSTLRFPRVAFHESNKQPFLLSFTAVSKDSHLRNGITCIFTYRISNKKHLSSNMKIAGRNSSTHRRKSKCQ